MSLLSSSQVERLLTGLPNWRRCEASVGKPERLVRSDEFDDFAQALHFVNGVAALAESANHHPHIEFGWGSARLEVWSHDCGGLTERDFELARAINRSFPPV